MAARGGAPSGDMVEAVLDASRALVALTVRSITAVEAEADLVAVRVLVFVAARETVALRDVADALGLHVSTASRLCDRLVGEGLLDRRDDPADRRQLALRLTAAGTRIVNRMLAQRRRAMAAVLDQLPKDRRAAIADALREFADAAGDVSERDLWAIGWTS